MPPSLTSEALHQASNACGTGTTTLIGGSCRFACLGLDLSPGGQDSHDLVGRDAQGIADLVALDASLVAQANEMGPRHSEKPRRLG